MLRISRPGSYLFTGRAYDAETALYHYRARYYDYYTGRLLQPDPMGYMAGLNLYTYCGNNPLNYVDPSGEFWSCVVGGFVGGVVGGVKSWRSGWTGAISGIVGGAVTGVMIGAGHNPWTAGAVGGLVGGVVNVGLNNLVYGDVTALEAVAQIGLNTGGGAVWASFFPGGGFGTGAGVGLFSGGASIMLDTALTIIKTMSEMFENFIRQFRVDEYNFSAKRCPPSAN